MRDILIFYWLETNFFIKLPLGIILMVVILIFINKHLAFLRLLLGKRIFQYMVGIVIIFLSIQFNIISLVILCFLLSLFFYNYIKLCNKLLSKHEYKQVYFLYRCLLSIISVLINIFLTYTIGFAESAIILDLQMQMQVLNQELLANQDILNDIQNSMANNWWEWICNLFSQWNYSCKIANIQREINELKEHLANLAIMPEEWRQAKYMSEVKDRVNSSSEPIDDIIIDEVEFIDDIIDELESSDVILDELEYKIDILNEQLELLDKEFKLFISNNNDSTDYDSIDDSDSSSEININLEIEKLMLDLDQNMAELDRLDELVGISDNSAMSKIDEEKTKCILNIERTIKNINKFNE